MDYKRPRGHLHSVELRCSRRRYCVLRCVYDEDPVRYCIFKIPSPRPVTGMEQPTFLLLFLQKPCGTLRLAVSEQVLLCSNSLVWIERDAAIKH
ncbi:unnamed protein product [Chondrus crispus]|uniref:Uncharacterized protein n=1 Tax=Chondrus crispus TaxID=2769 RepID=R7QI17_CHOCR|nr:unnamed protein product [Chondrus crispus]CDF38162.1 unnamed protein product [Chondrus crispus]|eukprot:XP_005718031.1 unnamed protein product [Chondrus crispus]